MSILIKGLKMPKEEALKVAIRGGIASVYLDEGKADYYSVIELPDHGDLIDREYAVGSACSGRIRALPTTEDGEYWIRVEEVRQSLKSVPAVIPAEREEASICENCDERSDVGCSWCRRMERSEDGET